jgi:hypothetical protein
MRVPKIRVAGKRKLEAAHDAERERALKAIRRLGRPFPPGFKFNREEIYEREWTRSLKEPPSAPHSNG